MGITPPCVPHASELNYRRVQVSLDEECQSMPSIELLETINFSRSFNFHIIISGVNFLKITHFSRSLTTENMTVTNKRVCGLLDLDIDLAK